MQIVVTISEREYVLMKTFLESGMGNDAMRKICNGIPLPKGHGELKDADAICKEIISALGIRDENYLLEAEKAVYKRIKNATTIIEADEAERSDKE